MGFFDIDIISLVDLPKVLLNIRSVPGAGSESNLDKMIQILETEIDFYFKTVELLYNKFNVDIYSYDSYNIKRDLGIEGTYTPIESIMLQADLVDVGTTVIVENVYDFNK